MLKDRIPRRRPEAQYQRHRRPRRQLRWNIPWRWVAAILPIFLVAGATYAAVNSSLLTVQAVRIEGARSLDHRALAEISGLRGQSMLTLSEAGARRRLMAIPEVEAVHIQRSWPNEVVITLVERVPVAFWFVNGHDFPVDQNGIVLNGGSPEGPAPRIVEVTPGRNIAPGDQVHPDAIAFAQRIMAESPRFLEASVVELEYETGVGVTVIFEGGLRVTFGDDRSYEYKIAVLSELLRELESQGVQPSAVDLRFGQRVTYE